MTVDQGFGGGNPKMRLAQRRRCSFVTAATWSGSSCTPRVDGGAGREAVSSSKASRSRPTHTKKRAAARYNPTYLYYTPESSRFQELASEYRVRKNATLEQFPRRLRDPGAAAHSADPQDLLR